MLNDFIRYLEAERRYSPLTVRNYRHDVEQFISWWSATTKEPYTPQKVTSDHLREWIVYRSDTGKIKAASLNRELSSLRSYFRYLLRREVITTELFARLPSLRTPQRLPSFVPEGRMRGILGQCIEEQDSFEEERDRLIILLFYACGLRLAELVALNREDLAADRRTLRVRGKGDKERLVPIVAYVAEKISAYFDTISRQQICRIGENALILTSDGKRISRTAVYRIVQRILGEANVQGKKSPHVLRHTFATHLMNGGADMREIQELMGHASLRSTQVYTHNSIARLGEVYASAHPRAKQRGKGEEEAEQPAIRQKSGRSE